MKPKIYTRDNVTLRKDKNNDGWYLIVTDVSTKTEQSIAIEESEIGSICDVCIEQSIQWGSSETKIIMGAAKS